MRILTKYLLRLHIGPFLFALAALTMLLLLNEVSRKFEKLVGKGLHWSVIAEVFVYSIPFILAQTLPMAVLIAVLYTFNRLAADNEITAIRAGGIPMPRILIPLVAAAVVLALGMVRFNDTVLPDSNHRLAVLLTSIGQKMPTFELREQTLNEVLPSRLYVQVGSVDHQRSELTDVAIYDQRLGNRTRTIYADSAQMAYNPDQTDMYLTLHAGVILEQEIEEPTEFQRVRFGSLIMRVEDVTNEFQRDELGGWRSDREMTIDEMQEEVDAARGRTVEARREARGYAVALTRLLTTGAEARREGASDDPTRARVARAGPLAAAGDEGRGKDRTTDAVADPTAGDQETKGGFTDSATKRTGADSPAGETGPDSPAGETGADSLVRETPADSSARETPADSLVSPTAARAADRDHAPSSAEARFRAYARDLATARGQANQYSVEIQKKYSIPAACIVFVLIGAPVAMRYPLGGVALVVAVSFGVFCAYYVALVGGEELADRLILSPFWAMWAPNVLFGAAGLGLVWRARRAGR